MTWVLNPYRFGEPGLHRYWEAFAVSGQTMNPAFGEWEFAASAGGADMTVPGSGSTTGQTYLPYFTGIANPERMIDDNLTLVSVAQHSSNLPLYGAAWRQDFGTRRQVREIRLTSRDAGALVTTPWCFILRGTDDLADWNTYVLETNAGWILDGIETKAWPIVAPLPKTGRANARAWRLYVTEVDGSTSRVSVAGLEFAASAGGASISNLPSGDPLAGISTVGAAFCSRCGGVNWTNSNPEKAFDGSASTRWFDNATTDAFIGMAFPAKTDVKEVRVTAFTSELTTMPRAGRVEYTTDFNTWHTAASFSGWTGWTSGQTRTLSVP